MAIKRRLEKKSDDAILDLTEAKFKATSFFEKNQKIILGVLIGLATGSVTTIVGFVVGHLIARRDHPQERPYCRTCRSRPPGYQ